MSVDNPVEPQKKVLQKKVVKQAGFSRSYYRKAYNLLDPRMEPLYKRFAGMEETVRKAGIRLTYRVYLCGMVLTTVIAAVVSALLGLTIVLALRAGVLLDVLLPIGLLILVGGLSFVVQFFRPRITAGNRKRRIDEDLAFTVSRMAVLSASGMTPATIIRNIASDDSNDLLTQEFRKIIRDINLLGMDLNQALIEERKRSPSDLFSSFLDGMVSTSSSGADIQQYLVKQSRTLMDDKRLKTKGFSETLGIIAEMYTTVLVVMPLILIILFAVMGVIAGSLGGVSITILIEIVIYAMVPLGGIMIMVLADGIMPRR